jgi:hypothetical protein
MISAAWFYDFHDQAHDGGGHVELATLLAFPAWRTGPS